ncbi:hypothetical protein [Botrimarina hoheduenensis]|uniref:Uncharacterized protein n=1 Tax=Botrimarina hoheduenensis TaxID=2528000 RepID=A0A5C5W9V8_9BACT|nr:hypothetical protein [Botrimarina hoheduenensis]TWT47277.1 hypothetical protein Pla111_08900 [Botrimarina hoheduenensis]
MRPAARRLGSPPARLAPPRRIALAIAIAAVGLNGCNRGPTFDDQVRACAKLSGASNSENPQLRGLIGAVRQQRAGPEQLEPLGFQPPRETNAAALLAEVFSDVFRKQLGEKLLLLVNSDASPAELLKNHAPAIKKIEEAGSLEMCRFSTDASLGYFAPLRYLDDVALAARFELLRSRHASELDNAATALECWRRGLRWCGWLGKVESVSARVLAATLRQELLLELQVQLETRLYGRYEAETIYGLLRDQLTDWPSDHRMLTGDRAMVLHAYEAIRTGLLDRMVTLEERKQLRAAEVYDRLMNPVPEELDQDEVNYLLAMDRLIGTTSGPYYTRRDAINEAHSLVTADPHLAAERMFFSGLPESLLLTARDRARCEAWCIALAVAAELVTPPFRENPVNGKPYEAQIDVTSVRISTEDPDCRDPECPML